ncbi:MAG: leucine-rich repeat domain-containing protein, partial [Prevotella nanceiensis]|nr:leucine-rich repeat domain-containing protein [Hoylesella nanceiensis]
YEVLAGTPTGIHDASLDNNVVETARYNVDGTKATTRTKGINIVKLSNGKVIKTIEK